MVTSGIMVNENPKNCRLAAAVDTKTFSAVHDLALETYRTPSEVVNSFIMSGLYETESILETTRKGFEAQILANKSAELVRNLKKIDDFYDFKVNFWQICIVLSGKMTKKALESPESAAFEDLISIIESFREDKPALYEDCCIIMRKTLNKSQKELMLSNSLKA